MRGKLLVTGKSIANTYFKGPILYEIKDHFILKPNKSMGLAF
jgi:hypothetical protein